VIKKSASFLDGKRKFPHPFRGGWAGCYACLAGLWLASGDVPGRLLGARHHVDGWGPPVPRGPTHAFADLHFADSVAI
jgi:hypothetical protein